MHLLRVVLPKSSTSNFAKGHFCNCRLLWLINGGDLLKSADLSTAAEKQRLKQLCKDFQSMIRTEDGARFFVFMMSCYNSCDVDSFIDAVSTLVYPVFADQDLQ